MPQRAATAQPLKRAEKKEVTRQQLIAATVDSIAASGFAETTLHKVSARANVSRSLVNFHFDSKEQLLVETLRHLTDEYRTFWMKAITRPGLSAAGKLNALVDADFHPQVCNRKKIAVWYAFWGESKSRPTYMEVCERADREFASAMERLTAEVVAEGGYAVDAVAAAKGLRCMIDGLWLELLLSPASFEREGSKRICRTYLAALFPRHFEMPGQVEMPAGGAP
ncbi:transcriptional regulator, TetR family [Tistlia consotensis]|uniref:Transcriptional regulator, TetR family n=1 Tax=Tistlia consotensis USBA 355 TaxID=560819 RepID=A0A1Y6BP74_9PROT|nr:transcriptional regulator BetI [Tistlia consotensis]SMF13725.1 transcriptional regulator, TetR family [Tistlia consotensis USBA 355]SNR50255.1 transcriptional regulator, TetR family [Tistlia consotensis]